MRVLLVEDDPLLGDGLNRSLASLGFTVDWVNEGELAVSALASQAFGCVVLDLGLPGMDGMAVLEQMRLRGDTVPVLVLTARDTKLDKLSAFGVGADDYIVKPIDIEELAARLTALGRRAAGNPSPRIRWDRFVIDLAGRSVRDGDDSIELSLKEFALLEHLVLNAGRVLTREQLEQSLYGWGEGAESNTIGVFIHHLRKKLDTESIKTLRGIGYMAMKS